VSEAEAQLRAVTWNLCGLEERALDQRSEAAVMHLLLRSDPPDVVLLQEVVRRSLVAHLRPHFAAAGYTLAPAEPVSDSEYFCAIAVAPRLRPTSAWRRPFPGSRMGRALLGLQVDWGGRDLLVCTAHLESLASGRRQRRAQVEVVADALADHDGPAVFGGDTNLRGDVSALLAPREVVDAFEVLGEPGPRATWWPLDAAGPRGRPLRFDRWWLGPGLRAIDLQVGRPRPVAGTRISDHRYVQLTFAG